MERRNVKNTLLTSSLLLFFILNTIRMSECGKRSSKVSLGDKDKSVNFGNDSYLTNRSESRRHSKVQIGGTILKPLSSSSRAKKNQVRSENKENKGREVEAGGSFVNSTEKNSGKHGQAKQSWLAVASAVAHSTAADTNHQVPVVDDNSKPTKYHYYPHNQHLYLLPECATQQVCSAVYLRLNYSQPLCACPNFHEPCSVSTRTDDRHTIPLVTGTQSPVLTLVKTCEPIQEVRECRAPKDWSILALQNSRTGKAHYLVICRCPAPGYLEGPIAHSQPAYARVPGIRVYGMTCVRTSTRTGRLLNSSFSKDKKDESQDPPFPWNRLKTLFKSVGLTS